MPPNSPAAPTVAAVTAAAPALPHLIRTTLWLALLPLIAIGVTGIGGFLAVRDASETVFYTREVLRISRQVAALANEREAALRGFLITPDSATLAQDLAAGPELRAKLDTLVAVPRDPAQRVRARAVVRAIARWEADFAAPVLAAPPERALDLARARWRVDKALFEEVRRSTAEFIAAEERLWTQRVRRDRFITDAIVGAFALEVLLLGLMYFRVRRRLLEGARTIIEQRARLEQQLAERTALADELKRANDELEGFSYAVAHDLRAPLRSVNGFARMLMDDYGTALDAEGRGLLDRIRVNSARAGTLIDGLLALARLRRGDLRSERVDLAALARTVVEDLRRATPDRDVEVRIADPLVARGDPRLLMVILQNLIGNAWKFTRDRPRPLIQVGSTGEDGSVAYFVKDNGVGFDMQYAGQLFGTFQRLHREHEFEGTGIGLVTVRRIVERHGGRVWVAAVPGEGATFYFSLPM